LEINYFGLVLL